MFLSGSADLSGLGFSFLSGVEVAISFSAVLRLCGCKIERVICTHEKQVANITHSQNSPNNGFMRRVYQIPEREK